MRIQQPAKKLRNKLRKFQFFFNIWIHNIVSPILTFGETPIFSIMKKTLSQFDPVYSLTLHHFKYTYPISSKKILRCTSNNIESTYVVKKCLCNYLHSHNSITFGEHTCSYYPKGILDQNQCMG